MYFAVIWLMSISVSFAIETIEITEIHIEKYKKTSDRRFKRNVPAKLPDRLAFQVETTSSRAILRLTKIKPLQTFTISADGVREHDQREEKERGVYLDESRKSVVMVERVLGRNASTDTRYKLKGNIEMDEKMIYFKPAEEEGGGGIGRGWWEDDEENIQHIIEGEHLILDPIHYSEKLRRKKRSAKSFKKYIIEICFIADVKDFEYFLERNAMDLKLTLEEMSIFYALVSEQLRIRYHSVFETNGSIDILTKTTALYIIEDREVSNFTTGLAVNDTDIDGVEALTASRDWLKEIAVPDSNITLPSSDHYMFFTGYDMVSGTNRYNVGRAFQAQLCSPNAVSMNENTHGGGLGTTIAHELGHGIGSGHDKDIGCKDENNFIMATTNSIPTSIEKGSHPWQFSECSVAVFKAELDKVDCVENDDRVDNLTTSYRGGEFYDWNEQCQLKFGLNSTICIGGPFGDYPLCYLMFCNSSGICNSLYPQEHTKCGPDMWCHKGACIPKENEAPVITNLPQTLDLTSGSVSGELFTVLSKDDDGDDVNYTYYFSPPEAEELFSFDNKTGVLSVKSCLENKTTLNETELKLAVAVSDEYYISYPQVFSWSLPPNFSLPVCEEPDYFLIYVIVGVIGVVLLLVLLALLIFCCLRFCKRRRAKKRLNDSRQRLDEADGKTDDTKVNFYTREQEPDIQQDVEEGKVIHHISQTNINSKHTHQSSSSGRGKRLAPPTPMMDSPTIRGKSRNTASKRVQNILTGTSNVVQPLDETYPLYQNSAGDSHYKREGVQNSEKHNNQTSDASPRETVARNSENKPVRIRRTGIVNAPTGALTDARLDERENLSDGNQHESSIAPEDSPALSRRDFNPNTIPQKLIMQGNKEKKNLNSPTNSPSLSRKPNRYDKSAELPIETQKGLKPLDRPQRQDLSSSRRRHQITDASFRKISLVPAQNGEDGGLWDFNTDALQNGSDSDENRMPSTDKAPPSPSEDQPRSGERDLFDVPSDFRNPRKSVTGPALDVQSLLDFRPDEDDGDDNDLHDEDGDDNVHDNSYDDIHNTSYDDIQNDSYYDETDRQNQTHDDSHDEGNKNHSDDEGKGSATMDSFPKAVFRRHPLHKPFTHNALTAKPQHLHTPIPGHDITTTSYRVQLLLQGKKKGRKS